jgi:serine/threonine protein kinase
LRVTNTLPDREPTPPELDKTLKGVWATVAPYAETIARSPNSTIEPDHPHPDTGQRAGDLLGRLGAALDRDVDVALRLEGTLGQGGQGQVHLGTQLVLGRSVAVKSLRPEHRDERASLQLLREAWTTGALEHPNVVPVHDIQFDAERNPLVVLKRIEGQHWGALLGDAEAVARRFRARDLLQWNLGILLQVCNAASFAHDKGILHRDLKPENVMIGAYGEVYLVDWGIAVSLRDDGSGRLPLASHADQMAGTPCYMAPEMLGGQAERLSERTDIYLLGAILFELLAGAPPHAGQTAREVIASVIRSEPSLPDDAPAELCRICRRAMAPEPEDRFDSVEALRHAVQDFLQHQGSAQLAEQAERRLDELLERLEGADAEGDESQRRLRLYSLFSECRFGFHGALREWPGNEVALRGLHQASEAMVAYELVHNDPRAADALLAEMEDPSPDLRKRVEQARQAKQEQRQEMEQLARVGRDMDPGVGRKTRLFLAGVLGVFWTLLPLAGLWFYQFQGNESHRNFILTAVTVLVVALGLGIWARESLMKTALNRRIAASIIFLILAEILLITVNYILGVDPIRTMVYNLFLWAVIAWMAVISIEWRIFVAALGYTAGFLLTVHDPGLRYYMMSAGNLVLMINCLVIWRRAPAPDKQGLVPPGGKAA